MQSSGGRRGGFLLGIALAALCALTGVLILWRASLALGCTSGCLMVPLDLEIAQRLREMRSPWVVRFFAWVTSFGYWGVVFLIAATSSTLMVLNRRTFYLPGLWLALVANQITVTMMKTHFARLRPEFATYRELSASFPSGHSAASAVLYGFLTYLLIRERVLLPRPLAAAFGATAALLVGASRLVLGEHFLSDVLGGYLVGGLWLLAGIGLTEGLRGRAFGPSATLTLAQRRFASRAVIFCALVAILAVTVLYQRNLQGLVITLPEPAGTLAPAP